MENKEELQDKKNELVNLKLEEEEGQKKKLFANFEGKWKQLYKQIYSTKEMASHRPGSYDFSKLRDSITISYEHQSNAQVVDETHIRLNNFELELIDNNGVQMLRSTYEEIPMIYVREGKYVGLPFNLNFVVRHKNG